MLFTAVDDGDNGINAILSNITYILDQEHYDDDHDHDHGMRGIEGSGDPDRCSEWSKSLKWENIRIS
jgi:hypothetical protein